MTGKLITIMIGANKPMLKRFIAVLLALLLLVSFAGCKKGKDNADDNSNPSSSAPVSSDPTQDYDNDEWDEGENLTDEEREEIEDLWNDLVNNGGAEIEGGNSSDSSTTTSSNSSSSSDDSTNNDSTGESPEENNSSENSSDELSGEVLPGKVPGVW